MQGPIRVAYNHNGLRKGVEQDELCDKVYAKAIIGLAVGLRVRAYPMYWLWLPNNWGGGEGRGGEWVDGWCCVRWTNGPEEGEAHTRSVHARCPPRQPYPMYWVRLPSNWGGGRGGE